MKTITITDEQYDFLMNLSKELNSQDNRITADPIFCVYQKQLVLRPDGYGDHTDWFDDEGHVQTEEDIEEITREYKNNHSESNLSEEEILEELEFKQHDYDIKDVPVDGQVYFSEKAAQTHIDQNYYHYNKPFTYVDSAWRNHEWQIIREIVMLLTQKV